jgi:hypothetical protein
MSNVQGFNQSSGGGGSGILTINSNPPDGGGDYGLSGLNGLKVTQGVASSVISTPSGAFSFSTVAITSQAAVAGNAYVLTNTNLTTVSLPVNAGTNVGDTFKIIGLSGGYLISQAANQQIILGSDQSTIGVSGYAQCSGALFNAISLTCVSTAGGDYVWAAIDPPQGIFTVN